MFKKRISVIAIMALVGVPNQSIASTIGHAKGLCSYRSATDSSKNINQQRCTVEFGSVMQPERNRVIGFLRLIWADGVKTNIETISYRGTDDISTTIDKKPAEEVLPKRCGAIVYRVNNNLVIFEGSLYPGHSCD